ncbi:MAG: TIR domain-containing protein [Candidatus Hodarchaeales archaeon]
MVKGGFFSFYYERDAWRAAIIRNHWISKPNREDAEYIDSASWEEGKKKGDAGIKKWIDKNIKGTSVTAVLIGAETSKRKWVRYEIQKSLEKGNDMVGIRIQNLRNQNRETDKAGDLNFCLVDGENTFSDLFPVYDWHYDKGYENFSEWVDPSDNDGGTGIFETMATLFLGGLFLGAISSIFKPSCPRCKSKITKGVQVCPHCGVYLTWK